MSKVNLQELLNGDEPVYVLNRTGRMRAGQTSTFILTVKDSHGDSAQVTIPATKWPVDISAMVPRKALQESKDLFKACRPGGPLEIVAPDTARKMLQDPMAQKSVDAAIAKLERAGASKEKFTMQVQDSRSGSRQAEVPSALRSNAPNTPDDFAVQTPKIVVAKTDVGPRIKGICAGLQNHPDTADEVLALLAGIPDEEISVEELGFVVRQCRDSARVVRWAKAELGKRSAPDDLDEDAGPDDDEDDDAPAPSPAPRRRRHAR
jgi:hypothetical protein